MQMDNIKPLRSRKNNLSDYKELNNLFVEKQFFEFIESELLPSISISSEKFWIELKQIIEKFSPCNTSLLAQRDVLQRKIDAWYASKKVNQFNMDSYINFLKEIGYIAPEVEPFKIKTQNVDDEVSKIAAPQLVVPVSNARFAINACNARWGSLYDAVYGSDLIPNKDGKVNEQGYDLDRGALVIKYSYDFLDRAIPLEQASHNNVENYFLESSSDELNFNARLKNGKIVSLKYREKFIGFAEFDDATSYLFKNNDLHIEITVNPNHAVGRTAPGNVSDINIESAVSIILDCEDSVAAVDSEDKINVYQNCLELMKGSLSSTFIKAGKNFTRTLNEDRSYTSKKNESFFLKSRALMFIRNVGCHMKTDIVLDNQKESVYEGLLDAIVTVGCSIAGMNSSTKLANSRHNSIYIVKPKLHGPEECAFFNSLLDDVESMFNLPNYTIKVGLMDEERRTSCNLKKCIYELKDRIVFLNTGFLDRTGDEIHTNMKLGPVNYKERIKEDVWYESYEKNNVKAGIECGFIGKAQIGKGMWAKPDEYKEMMDVKYNQLKSGASCAWIPSPTAATLHAIHYHDYAVRDYQVRLMENNDEDFIRRILTPSCLLYTSPSPRDGLLSRMPSSA